MERRDWWFFRNRIRNRISNRIKSEEYENFKIFRNLCITRNACSTEDEQVRFAGDEAKVNATIGGESVFTRSNPVGTEDEQKLFNDNDQIGISVNGGAAHKYEMKNGVWGVAESVVPIKWESEATVFKAFYPYNGVSNSFDKGKIGAEQNTKEGLALSDYMKAEKSYPNIPENRQLDLEFKRQTARVVIDIENSTFKNEFANQSPSVAEIKIYSQLDLPATEGAGVEAIKAYKMDDSNPKSSWVALVAPNAEDASKDFICISVQENGTGTPKPYYIKGIPNLENGKSYTYKLTIGKNKAIINNVEVADWGEGKLIPGGEASPVTVESIKASVAKQFAENKFMYFEVVLELPSNASSDLFKAINEAMKTAIDNDKNISASNVTLTLKGVLTIPEGAFDSENGVGELERVILPDVTSIKSKAFNGPITDILYAPKVSMIESQAFCNCYSLSGVTFGALRLVGEDPFYQCVTDWLSLGLSSRQAQLKFDGDAWRPTEQSYWDTGDKDSKKFLGLTFKRIEQYWD